MKIKVYGVVRGVITNEGAIERYKTIKQAAEYSKLIGDLLYKDLCNDVRKVIGINSLLSLRLKKDGTEILVIEFPHPMNENVLYYGSEKDERGHIYIEVEV